MDERGSTTTPKRASSVITPPERGEILIRDRKGSGEAESWANRCIHFIVALGPRFFELLAVLLLSSGINILTALLDATPERLTRLISAVSFILAGGLLFFFSSHVERSYDDAKAQQRNQAERKEPITQLAILATDIMTFDQKRLKWKFLTLAFAVILFLVGLGTLVNGWAHQGIATQPNQPSLSRPSTQAPSETGPTNPSGAPVDNNSNNNSSGKTGEKKTSGP